MNAYFDFFQIQFQAVEGQNENQELRICSQELLKSVTKILVDFGIDSGVIFVKSAQKETHYNFFFFTFRLNILKENQYKSFYNYIISL